MSICRCIVLSIESQPGMTYHCQSKVIQHIGHGCHAELLQSLLPEETVGKDLAASYDQSCSNNDGAAHEAGTRIRMGVQRSSGTGSAHGSKLRYGRYLSASGHRTRRTSAVKITCNWTTRTRRNKFPHDTLQTAFLLDCPKRPE